MEFGLFGGVRKCLKFGYGWQTWVRVSLKYNLSSSKQFEVRSLYLGSIQHYWQVTTSWFKYFFTCFICEKKLQINFFLVSMSVYKIGFLFLRRGLLFILRCFFPLLKHSASNIFQNMSFVISILCILCDVNFFLEKC